MTVCLSPIVKTVAVVLALHAALFVYILFAVQSACEQRHDQPCIWMPVPKEEAQ